MLEFVCAAIAVILIGILFVFRNSKPIPECTCKINAWQQVWDEKCPVHRYMKNM
jgi:hypothetical protein